MQTHLRNGEKIENVQTSLINYYLPVYYLCAKQYSRILI